MLNDNGLVNLGFCGSLKKDYKLSGLEENIINLMSRNLPLSKLLFYRFINNGFQMVHNYNFDLPETLFIESSIINGVTRGEKVFDIIVNDKLKNLYLSVFNDNDFVFTVFNYSLSNIEKDNAVMFLKCLGLALKNKESAENEFNCQFTDLVLRDISSGIIVIDNNENIIFINKSAGMILGYKPQDLEGCQCGVIFRDIDGDNNWLSFALRNGAPSSRKKIYLVRKDGIGVAVGGTTSLIKGKDGSTIGVVGIFKEFEEFQKSENNKRDINKMSLLSKLSASIAHEIRNPLAGISATAQVLASKLGDDERKKKFISIILEEIDRINRIIKELLTFSSPSKATFLKSNINKILESSLDLVHKKIQRQGIDVVREYDEQLIDVLCDENQIKQAVVNIMLNSINAMPEGGMLVITTGSISDDSGRWVKIKISDTGPGIPKEVLNELFLPFTSTKTQGLGLGLTITKNIVQSHKGRIKAKNIDPKGAQVVMLIPADLVNSYDEQTYLPFYE